MSSDDMIEDTKNLRSAVMNDNWQEVLSMFKEKRELRTARITATGDTVLHIAASKLRVDVVERMVDMVCGKKINDHDDDMSESVTFSSDDENGDERKFVFEAENEKGNTPLHVAAAASCIVTIFARWKGETRFQFKNRKGQTRKLYETLMESSVAMCKKIGSEYPSLIVARNKAGETPLFLAALHGKRDTFLCLHRLYVESNEVSPTDFAHCIRDNDDTILHCAIAGGYIDVAIEIVCLYKDHLKELMRRNKEDLSPLHLLAAQPSAFRSYWLREHPYLERPLYGLFKFRIKNNQAYLHEELLTRREIYKQLRGEKHRWSLQVMKELLQHASDEDMSRIISKTTSGYLSVSLQTENKDEELESDTITIETPLMIATKNGVTEMVDEILKSFPSRIKDVNTEGKNIVLLAIEYRQWGVYWFLRKQKWQNESLFEQVDKEGNNALHLAAMIESNMLSPMEINWFECVKASTPPGLLGRYNRKMETPEDIFNENYMELMNKDAKWVAKASQAFSVVSTLVTTVAFATRSSVPGGYDNKGYATLRRKPSLFKAFAYCEIFALCLSLISTLIFLSVATSPPQSVGSLTNVAEKLDGGMSYMFLSLALLWISFCAGHFFTLGKTNYAILTYIFLSFLIILFFFNLLPTFLVPILSRYSPIPASRCKVTPPIEYRRTKNKKTVTMISLKGEPITIDLLIRREDPLNS